MRLAVIGTRSINPLSAAVRVCATLHNMPSFPGFTDTTPVIVSGGAIGPDSFAEAFAKAKGWKTAIYLPDWDKHGKSAGFKRNQKIIDVADAVLAFWDGKSRGTAHSLKLAIQAKKPIEVHIYNTDDPTGSKWLVHEYFFGDYTALEALLKETE